MGIDFSHGGAHWGYGGFYRFRQCVADEIGINLDEMEGFGGTTPWKGIRDPICFLLNHSDCDGHLTVKQCQVVSPRLRELVAKWPDDYDRQNALRLADGMDEAAKKGRPLEFC
jgi:xanthine dehydrogenase molybdopterin-binding subunit B